MKKQVITALTATIALSLITGIAYADGTSVGVLDKVVNAFEQSSSQWKDKILNAASFLFWSLGVISLVWTGCQLILRKADIGEFFAEFIKFIIFFGLMWWLLLNGPKIAQAIIQSMSQLGASASGKGTMTPSNLVSLSFQTWDKINSSVATLGPSHMLTIIGTLVCSLVVLFCISLVAINMMLLLISAWVMMYAGIFLLGFGGCRWTSDIAWNYYKTVLGLAMQILTMILLIGVCSDVITDCANSLGDNPSWNDLGVMAVASIAFLLLVEKVPPMISGIITGASIGNTGIGNYGAAAAAGAIAGAVARVSGGFKAAGGAAAGGAGAVSAIKAAYSAQQQQASGGGGGGGSSLNTGAGGGGGGGANKESSTSTPFSQAAGMSLGSSIKGTMKQLAQGMKGVAADKISQNTAGGRLAAKIKSMNDGGNTERKQEAFKYIQGLVDKDLGGTGGTPSFGNDSIGGDTNKKD